MHILSLWFHVGKQHPSQGDENERQDYQASADLGQNHGSTFTGSIRISLPPKYAGSPSL